MKIQYCDIIKDIRISLDEIVGSDAKDDDFATDVDTELRQAVKSAIEQLLMERSVDQIDVKQGASSVNVTKVSITASIADALVDVPTDLLRFVSMRFSGWGRYLFDLTDQQSDKAKMQGCKYVRGTKDKPVAILITSASGTKCINVCGAEGTLTDFSYVDKPTTDAESITCSLHDVVYKNIIYRAAAIFLDTHRVQQSQLYYALSKQ
jgi:hypothetical protein